MRVQITSADSAVIPERAMVDVHRPGARGTHGWTSAGSRIHVVVRSDARQKKRDRRHRHVQAHRDESREGRVVHPQEVEPGEEASDDGAAVLPP